MVPVSKYVPSFIFTFPLPLRVYRQRLLSTLTGPSDYSQGTVVPMPLQFRKLHSRAHMACICSLVCLWWYDSSLVHVLQMHWELPSTVTSSNEKSAVHPSKLPSTLSIKRTENSFIKVNGNLKFIVYEPLQTVRRVVDPGEEPRAAQ